MSSQGLRPQSSDQVYKHWRVTAVREPLQWQEIVLVKNGVNEEMKDLILQVRSTQSDVSNCIKGN